MSNFYDDLCRYYHLIFEDWNKSIERQALQLNELIQNHWPQSKSILDISCGIGTQSIGLAQYGYEIVASDLSENQIQRAKHEAQQRQQTNISFSVCDMRNISSHHRTNFDLIISCDNSIPHLLRDEEILHTFKEIYHCLKSGGGCLITIRDYDREQSLGQNLIKPYGKAKIENGKRFIPIQVWDFDEQTNGQFYDLTFFIIEEDLNSKQIQTHSMRSRYYAIKSQKFIQLMENAGFINIQRLDEVFYQPVYIATKPY